MILKFLRIIFPMLAFALLLANATPTHGQTPGSMAIPSDQEPPDCDAPQFGILGIYAHQEGYADLSLTVCFDPARKPESNQSLVAALGCSPEQTRLLPFKDEGLDGIEVSCELRLSRRALRFSNNVNIVAIQTYLKSAGAGALSLHVWMPPNGSGGCDPASGGKIYGLQDGVECDYVLKGAADDPPVIGYSFGYGPALVERIVFILAFLLLTPIALTLWFRQRAFNVPEESKPTVVFAYRRFITWTARGGVLVWWVAIDVLHADDLVQFLLPKVQSQSDMFATFLTWILLWIPPAIVYFLCLLLSSPIHSLRGMTRTQGQALNQSFWAVARFVLPLSLLILGLAELFSSPRIGVLLIAAWFVTARLANQKFADSYGMELHALTSGDLRDRAFAIAKKAGAKLNQLYVLPAERLRMANAFAHIASNIYLTDYLLKNLSKREVDAVIGHEMTHLQKKHIRLRVFVVIIAAAAGGFGTAWAEGSIPSGFPVGPVIYGIFLFVLFFASRRNEFSADAGAVQLTGDAEAMITALAKISRLNTMPLHWGRLDEKMLTHPSTMRRIRHLASTGGISEDRIPGLLAQSTDPPADVYSIPATALPSGKVFSTRFKARLAWIYGWTLILGAATVPALIVLVIRAAHPSVQTVSIALLLGIVLTLFCCLGIINYVSLLGTRKLGARLREKLEKEGSPPEIRDGVFVSLMPDSTPRIYEGNWSWDLGLLTVFENRLVYWGEEARFSVHRDQITRISLGPGPVTWLKTPAVYVAWQDSGAGERVFNLRALNVTSMLEMARQTRRLAADLENWHRGITSRPGSLLAVSREGITGAEALGIPGFGQVTSTSPRFAFHANYLARIFMFDLFVAVAIAILFGIRIPIFNEIAPLSAPLDLNTSGGAILYILVTIWITRSFQLWPVWRFREPTPQTVPQATPTAPAPVRPL